MTFNSGLPLIPRGRDVSAGFLVALVGIPQCLAYAMLAGLPPMYGLSTAIVAGLVAAVLGRSATVNVGPTNTTGLIILAALLPYAASPEALLPAMAVLTILAGLWRLFIVFARAERIFNFIPESVLLGFATGAAVTIAWLQVDDLLGQPLSGVRTSLEQAIRLGTQLDWGAISWIGAALAFGTVAAVLVGRRFLPSWPIALIVLVVATVASMAMPDAWQARFLILGDSASISNGWPQGALPALNPLLWVELLFPALAIALIGSLELIVTLRNHREMALLSTELRAQGAANVVAGLASGFPASASLTRSALLRLGGARTRSASVIASLVLVPVLLFGGLFMQQIPLAVIAGLLLATAFTMLDQNGMRQLWLGNRQTRSLFLTTLIATLCMPFHWAILAGTGLSIVVFLAQTSKPTLRWYKVDTSLHLTRSYPPNNDPESTWYVQVSGSLYFAAAKTLPTQLQEELPTHCRRLYIDLADAHQLRMSAATALREIVDIASEKGVTVDIGNAGKDFMALADRAGIDLPLRRWRLSRQLLISKDQ